MLFVFLSTVVFPGCQLLQYYLGQMRQKENLGNSQPCSSLSPQVPNQSIFSLPLSLMFTLHIMFRVFSCTRSRNMGNLSIPSFWKESNFSLYEVKNEKKKRATILLKLKCTTCIDKDQKYIVYQTIIRIIFGETCGYLYFLLLLSWLTLALSGHQLFFSLLFES